MSRQIVHVTESPVDGGCLLSKPGDNRVTDIRKLTDSWCSTRPYIRILDDEIQRRCYLGSTLGISEDPIRVGGTSVLQKMPPVSIGIFSSDFSQDAF